MALRTYWIVLLVWFPQPIDIEDDDPDPDQGPVVGYYTTIGVTAESERVARDLVTQAVTDGRIDWADSEINEVAPETLDEAVVARSTDWDRKGIWYRGGRILFSADDGNSEPAGQS